ncbi:MAG: lycopene cyclase domain-containing protein [Candidatus Nanoarchaeia archaeon]|jgi:hypothetical protein|nr:lycopene cyclase domain-containing protein [Candidatus Nanoarchaeia archaeon]MDD3993837.1 lycopene cyclase domain-containing protein [Candidatus Nanoarchaeia archaeon]
MSYLYSYLIGDLTLLIVWFILFYFRKNVRKEMLIISLLIGIGGLFAETIYTIDWWQPLTITGTLIGIEDFLFGFAIGGIGSSIYEVIFKKTVKIKKINQKKRFNQNKNILLFGASIVVLLFITFFLMKLNSFYSSIISLGIPIIYMNVKRKDLILNSILSGFFLMLTSFLAFITVELITPGWINSAWFLENLSGIIILTAPLEDLIWFFLMGMFIGPLYEFWKEGKIQNLKKE